MFPSLYLTIFIPHISKQTAAIYSNVSERIVFLSGRKSLWQADLDYHVTLKLSSETQTNEILSRV